MAGIESEYGIKIKPPSKWYYRSRKLIRFIPHWFKIITDPTYRDLSKMLKDYRNERMSFCFLCRNCALGTIHRPIQE